MKKKAVCPLCGSVNSGFFLTGNGIDIYECGFCTIKFCHPVPSPKKLEDFYRQGYFEGHIKGAGGYKNYQEIESELEKEANKKLEFIRNYLRGGELLDIGAGTGIFAGISAKSGFHSSANDISPFAVNAIKKRGLKCYPGPVEKRILPGNSFDIVTAWDVIEHVPFPGIMLDAVEHTLKKGGLFFLTTPDSGSWDAKLTGKLWYGYKKLPEHLVFLNSKSVRILFEMHNFEVVSIKQWGFYRKPGFVIDKLGNYGKIFQSLGNLFLPGFLKKHSFFFPMTDFMVVARKK